MMSPLSEAIWAILRLRPERADPRISYGQLAAAVRDRDDTIEGAHHRDRRLYAALSEVHAECLRLGLPSLAALVVRADSRRPGEAYFQGDSRPYRGERIEAWRREVEAVKQTAYPSRSEPA